MVQGSTQGMTQDGPNEYVSARAKKMSQESNARAKKMPQESNLTY